MSDLLDEVRASFESSKDEVSPDQSMRILTSQDELAPGFMGMKEYFQTRILAITRRAYRHHAGGTLPEHPLDVLHLTSHQMMEPLIATGLGAFAAGVKIGHCSDYLVRMMSFLEQVDHLFHEDEFAVDFLSMAEGFADDDEVTVFFGQYITQAVAQIAQVTGFDHHKEPAKKVWDVWLLAGTAVTTASFLAGHRMGTTWRERDVLDGILIATEEGGNGAEGAGATDRGADEGDQEPVGGEQPEEH